MFNVLTAQGATMEAVNHSKNSAMEADTISKHGASSKSLMSRGILFKIVISIFLFCSFNSYGQENYWTESYRIVFSQSFKDGKITLKKKINLNDFRRNPQGHTFYRTTFAVDFEYENKITTTVIDSDAYTREIYEGASMPCMLIDEKNQIISIFTNSKASDPMFGMDGFVYRMEKNSNKWVKEIVFTGANLGWYPFFGGSDNGNPELWHFSHVDHFSMLSKRTSSNTWNTQRVERVNLETVRQKHPSRKNVLITSSSGVDKMSNERQ